MTIQNGTLTITTSDGKTFSGNAGGPGAPGVGITNIAYGKDGSITITTSDGKTWTSSANQTTSQLQSAFQSNGIWCANGVCNLPSSSGSLSLTPNWSINDENGILVLRNTNAKSDSRYAFFPGVYSDFGLNTIKIGNSNLNLGADGWIRALSNPSDIGSYNAGFAGSNIWAKGTVYALNKIALGNTNLVPGADGWVRALSNPADNSSYNAGLAGTNLWARDRLYAGGRDILAEIDDLKANAVRKDKFYGIKSGRGGYLSDQGGWKAKPSKPTDWEAMVFDQAN